MRFWDASAIVPLLIEEPRSGSVENEYRRDPGFVVWWGTDIECVSALARRERDGAIESDLVTTAIARLDLLGAAWQEVQPSGPLRRAAIRLLRVHALRAADALQLAAAVAASEGDSRSLVFVTLDERLAQAAVKEGFPLADIPRS